MNFLNIIFGTPAWVWFIFVYLLVIGIKSSKNHTVPLWRLALTPLVFVVWSGYSIYYRCTNCFPLFGLWLTALVIGSFIGYKLMRSKFTIGKEKLIYVSGTFTPLLLSMTFFIFKYALGSIYALYPSMRANLQLISLDVVLSGFIVGIFVGRFGCILYKYLIETRKKL